MHFPDLILFDLDGTLISTEHAVTEANLRVMEEQSGVRDEAMLLSLVGIPFKEKYNVLFSKGFITSSAETYARDMDAHRIRIYEETGIDFLPGVRQLLEQLQQARVPMGVVSASRRSSIETKKQYVDLDTYFQVIISGTDVAQSKPHPAPYLKAHRHFHTPTHTVVFEDSLPGLEAAHKAGLTTIALGEDIRQQLPTYVDQWFKDLSDVEQVLGYLQNKK